VKSRYKRDTKDIEFNFNFVAMTTQTLKQPLALDEMFARVWNAGHLTRTERQTLMSVVLSNNLSPEEEDVLNRIFHAVRRGWLKICD
jgi:hypothetical protein